MDVRNGVGGPRVFYEQVVDFRVVALLETNPEIRFRQGADVVADVRVLDGHVHNHVARWQFAKILVFFRLQHAHEAEILGRDFGVHIALQDVVRHLVAQNHEPAAQGAEQGLGAALDVLDDAFVVFVKNNQYRINSLIIRKFCCSFLGEKLLQGMI